MCDDDTVAIFFMLILETKWNGKKFVVLFQVKKVSALHERFHVHVFSNLTKSFFQRMTPISRFLAKHRNSPQTRDTGYTPNNWNNFSREGKKNNFSFRFVSFLFLSLFFFSFFLFQTIKTRIRYHKIVDLLQFRTIVGRVYRQTYINSFCLFVYRTVAFLG